jgi:hypothetical protein
LFNLDANYVKSIASFLSISNQFLVYFLSFVSLVLFVKPEKPEKLEKPLREGFDAKSFGKACDDPKNS